MFQFQVEISDNPLYETAKQLDLFYVDNTGEPINGSYKGTQVAFIDFSLEGINAYLDVIHNTVLEGMEYDGVTFTDNWPADDTYVMSHNYTFPYISEVRVECTYLNSFFFESQAITLIELMKPRMVISI